MIQLALGLTAPELTAIAELEARVVAHDGGRLKLEWSRLRSRPGAQVEDVLAWEAERLVGFLGIYGFSPPTVELAGMVDPEARRRGIATALLDAGLGACRERGARNALLIVPRTSPGGRALAQGRGATLHHSEHALVLEGEPAAGSSDPQITLRTARAADVGALESLFTAGFGSAPADLAAQLVDERSRTLVIVRDRRPVGTARVTLDGDLGRIYGFVVDPALQGRGIGRDVLRRMCRTLRAEGASRVGLEVEVDNDHALRLYTSLGFAPVATEDYWSVPLTPLED